MVCLRVALDLPHTHTNAALAATAGGRLCRPGRLHRARTALGRPPCTLRRGLSPTRAHAHAARTGRAHRL